MPPAVLPQNEPERLAALQDLGVLDTAVTPAFDALVRAASLACQVPISLISLVDEHRQWFKANLGLDGVAETPRDFAFCAHAILQDGILEVPDACADPRFNDNPLVTGNPNIRFYAGMPLTVEDGMKVGTLCVIDRRVRQLTAEQREVLQALGVAASAALEQARAEHAQRIMAAQLRRSELFLERAGRLAGVGGWMIDLATNVLSWSPEVNKIHGLSGDVMPSLDDAIDFFPPSARGIVRQAVKDAIETGQPYDLELPFIRADGTPRWVRTMGELDTSASAAGCLFGAIQDVTAQVTQRLELQHARERKELAIESGHIGVWDWDITSGRLFWNDWMHKLFGLTAREGHVPDDRWRSQIHPDDQEAAHQSMRDALSGRRAYDTEFRVLWPDGSEHILRATATVSRDARGQAIRMVGATWDITQARRLAADLASQHELLRTALQSIGDGVITTDAEDRIVWMNPIAERLTGWGVAEAAGRPVREVFNIVDEETRQPAELPAAADLTLDRALAASMPGVLLCRQGGEIEIENSAAPIRGDKGNILGLVLVFHDLTEQRQRTGEMTYRATHDLLTGLLNRNEFEVRLRFILHKANTDFTEHSLLFIDLDEFKLVNDTCGHAAGDELLVQVTKLLTEVVRASDTIARLGGDEFAIILDHCPAARALPAAQKICDLMEQFRFVHDQRRFHVGASIGLVPLDSRWESPAAAMQAADSSCHAAKEAGRNRVHVWFDSDQAMHARHGQTQWAGRLAQALDDDNFVLFAQRIERLVDHEDGQDGLVHAEVLLRMQEAGGALFMPGAFLPAAERFHMASRIDRWVLSRSIQWMNAAPSLEEIDTLCVNLSGQSVGDRAFHRWAIAMLSEAGPRICRRLCLEITETAAVTNLADAAVFIEQVRRIGVRVALDDFGAGASSFGYLKTMPVDFLKIDGQFVRDLMTDSLDEAAVRCFADVAAVVGMQTIAEFVDDAQVLAKLRTMGVDFAQGFLIHRPAPIEELLGLERRETVSQ